MKKIKKALALAISCLPSGILRRLAYSTLLGYKFGPGSHVGWRVYIAVDSFECGRNVRIRRQNSFVGPIKVMLGDETLIGRYNRFECGDSAADASQSHMNYAREFITGRDCLIHESHLFDLLGRIRIGNGSWVAGFGSQFLTHGASAMNRDITIGDHCFLGSAIRFTPGSGVGDKVVVGMGAVVTKYHAASNVVVGGFPAKVIRERGEDDAFVFQKGW